MSELPSDLDKCVNLLLSHGGLWIYLLVALSMILEYIFPPYPGDVAIFAGGYISAAHNVSIIAILIMAYIGSVIGFSLVYFIGKRSGRALIASNRIKFISPGLIERSEKWYKKVGEKLLIVSKFLPGLRFVLVFFSGIANVNFKKAFIFISISCLVWNSMVILLAFNLQKNINKVYGVLSTYRDIVLAVIIILALFYLSRYFANRRRIK